MAAQLWLCRSIPNVTGTVGAGGAGTAPGSPSIAPAGALAVGDGINAAYAVFSQATATAPGGISLSISDVINFFLLPEGAVVIDGYLCGVVKNGTGTVFKVGLGAAGNPAVAGASTDGDFIAAVTYSATRVLTRFNQGAGGIAAGMPYFPAAITNTTFPKYYPVNATLVSGSSTGSVSLGMYILYTVAQPGAVFA